MVYNTNTLYRPSKNLTDAIYEHLYSRSANNYNFYGKPRNAVLRLKNGRLAA